MTAPTGAAPPSRERRRLDAGFAAAVVVLVLVAIASAASVRSLRSIQHEVRETDEELLLITSVLSNLQDAQLGQRGYLLARQEAHLEPYYAALARLGGDLDALAVRTADDPENAALVERLRDLAAAHLAFLERVIGRARRGDFDAAVEEVRAGEGKRRMDEIRDLTAGMRVERMAVNDRLRARAASTAAFTTLVVVLGSGIAILIVLVSRARIRRELRSREAAEARLASSERSLRGLYRIAADPEPDLDAKLLRLLELGRERFGLRTGLVARIDGDRHEIVQVATEGDDLRPGDVHPLGDTYCAAVVERGGPVVLEHARAAGWAARHCYAVFGLESYVGAPIRTDDTLYGTLAFADREPRTVPFTESDRDFLLLMAQWVGAEIQRRQAEDALRQREERYRVLVESANDLIYTTDLEGRFAYVNPTAVRTTGYTAGELRGMHFLQLVREDARDEVRARYASGGPPPAYGELPIVTRDGREVWIGQNVELLREGGRVVGVQAVARDITRQVEVERLKDEFLSVVSHELRTPLTAIRGSLGLLASGKLGTLAERGQRMLEIAAQNTDRLVRLINDLLDIEKMESGRIALERRDTRADELVREAVEVMAPMAERAGVVLEAEAPPEALWVDPDRILQVLTNLVSNAVKFSPEGGRVRVEAHAGEEEVEFRVSDRGRGIPSDKLEAVFERFQQVDSSDSREKGGTGLGLPIARSIVRQHGGRMWVESRWGEGSTFHFALPRLSGRPEEPGSPAACDVLIVEDDDSVAQVLAEALAGQGVSSCRAATGTEAIRLSDALDYRLLVLDPGLPDQDGFAVVRALRGHPSHARVPVLVYTSRDLTDEERDALRLGPAEFLTKSRDAVGELERWALRLLSRPPGPTPTETE